MSPARNPTGWDDYEGGPSPRGSVTDSMLEREQALADDDDDDAGEHDNEGGLTRRRRRYV
jgi:vesicular inhibitory amino acid transporter